MPMRLKIILKAGSQRHVHSGAVRFPWPTVTGRYQMSEADGEPDAIYISCLSKLKEIFTLPSELSRRCHDGNISELQRSDEDADET